MLLCLRCNVSCNDNVTLHETLTDESVAFQLRISNEEWQKTKQILLSKKLIDEYNLPINWDKRQYTSDSSNERVKRYREKKKQECNVTVTPPEADTDISTTANAREFVMHDGWDLSKTWRSVSKRNGLIPNELTSTALDESLREFISYWVSDGKPRKQGQWEHLLAQAIVRKRRFAEGRECEKSKQRSYSGGKSAVERVRANIRELEAKEGVISQGEIIN